MLPKVLRRKRTKWEVCGDATPPTHFRKQCSSLFCRAGFRETELKTFKDAIETYSKTFSNNTKVRRTFYNPRVARANQKHSKVNSTREVCQSVLQKNITNSCWEYYIALSKQNGGRMHCDFWACYHIYLTTTSSYVWTLPKLTSILFLLFKHFLGFRIFQGHFKCPWNWLFNLSTFSDFVFFKDISSALEIDCSI